MLVIFVFKYEQFAVLEVLLDGGMDDQGALVLERILSQLDPTHRSLARRGRSFFVCYRSLVRELAKLHSNHYLCHPFHSSSTSL